MDRALTLAARELLALAELPDILVAIRLDTSRDTAAGGFRLLCAAESDQARQLASPSEAELGGFGILRDSSVSAEPVAMSNELAGRPFVVLEACSITNRTDVDLL